MSSNKNIKSYLKEIDSIIWKNIKNHFNHWNYNKRILNFFVKNKNYHPLSFLLLLNKVFRTKFIKGTNEFLAEVTNEELFLDNIFLSKRDKSLLFEWFCFFHSFLKNRDLEIRTNFKESEEKKFKADIKLFLKSLYENININAIDKNDELYKTIFQTAIRFESMQRPLLYRLYFILDLFKDKLQNYDLFLKFYIILCWILYQKEYETDCVFNIEKLEKSISNFWISHNEINSFLEKMWINEFDNYLNSIQSNSIEFYFPIKDKEYKYNKFINNIWQIHKTPFLSEPINKNNLYYDDSILIKKFYSMFSEHFLIRDEKNKSNKDRLIIIEDYTKKFIEEWFLYSKESKLDKNKYLILNGEQLKFKWKKPGDIDLLIYNKDTKNVILFEIKDKIDINEELYEVLDIEELTRKEIIWRNENKPWTIYKGIEQLINHVDRDISSKFPNDLKNVKINEIQYVFLNHYNSFFWNEIIRTFVDKNQENIDSIKNKYHFMSLYEFELLISLWNRKWIDFFELLCEKSIIISPEERYSIIPKFTRIFDDFHENNIKSNPKGIHYWFQEFFREIHSYQQYEWTLVAPFVNAIDFTNLLK